MNEWMNELNDAIDNKQIGRWLQEMIQKKDKTIHRDCKKKINYTNYYYSSLTGTQQKYGSHLDIQSSPIVLGALDFSQWSLKTVLYTHPVRTGTWDLSVPCHSLQRREWMLVRHMDDIPKK